MSVVVVEGYNNLKLKDIMYYVLTELSVTCYVCYVPKIWLIESRFRFMFYKYSI
jgi:hypothetical protein